MNTRMFIAPTLLLVLFAISIPSYAAAIGGRVRLHFDENMNFVGQQIRYCSGSSQHQGDISTPYYRDELYQCWQSSPIINGYSCVEQADQSYLCKPAKTGADLSKVIATLYHLPGSVTLEDSCSFLTCVTPFDEPQRRTELDPLPVLGGFQ